MSHAAVAAVLARGELSAGEGLVAWSLASFANREQLAWPGIVAAAARAGLSRSRYLEARELLVRRALLEVESRGVGRGESSTVRLLFAQSGPWCELDVNVELAETVLSYSGHRGPARLLLVALAALSDSEGAVEGLATEELCRVAGLANSTYRRSRAALLASGEVNVADAGGGRGRTCRWFVRAPADLGVEARVAPRRLAPSRSGDRPVVAVARATGGANVEKGPAVSGVSVAKGPLLSGVSARKGPSLSGVLDANAAKTPPETPPPNARAGREPLNPRTRNPPDPPEGGRPSTEVFVEETYRTERGRTRRRRVPVDIDATCAGFRAPTLADVVDWQRTSALLAGRVGESTFEIWLAPLELRAVDAAGALVVDPPAATRSWVTHRFRRVIGHVSGEAGRSVVIAHEAQSRAMDVVGLDPVRLSRSPSDGVPSDTSACPSYDASACELAYTGAYNNQTKEVG
jgi:hypothetical protein